MSILTPIIQAWTWFKKNVVDHTKDAAKVAMVVTETVKTLLANPVTGFLTNLLDTVTNTQLPTEVVNIISGAIPKILAVELGIQGLPDNPTPDQILAFEQAILKAFNVNADNSKLYTILGAQVYGIIQDTLNNTPGKFADWVNAVEQAYISYQKDLQANATTGIIDLPVGTKLSNGNQIVESANQAIKETIDPNLRA